MASKNMRDTHDGNQRLLLYTEYYLYVAPAVPSVSVPIRVVMAQTLTFGPVPHRHFVHGRLEKSTAGKLKSNREE